MEERHYAGVCGLYCGLCPRFQSTAPSRCLGCHLGAQHSYCSVYRCCVTRHGHFTCADCDEYPCERLLRVLGVEEGLDSFISHKPALANLDRIRAVGLETFLSEQRERRLLVEQLLANYNEGRSMTFYCTACALMPPDLIRQAIGEMEEILASEQVDSSDLKAKAKAMKTLIKELALQADIDLKPRRKKRRVQASHLPGGCDVWLPGRFALCWGEEMGKLQLDRVNRFLLRKQHLAPETHGDDVVQVVHDICALHSTAAMTPYLSLWSRMKGFHRQWLDEELYERHKLVRIPCMRATLHIVPTETLAVFFQATRERLQRRFLREASRLLVQAGLCQEGEEAETLERVQQRIVEVLAGRGPSTVSELCKEVPELAARIKYSEDRPYAGEFRIGSRIVSAMCILGLLVRARPRGSWHSNLYQYASLTTWLPDVDLKALTPVEAQVHLVQRYLAALGPATAEDIAWWSGFSKGETAKALSALGDEVVEAKIEGLGGGYLLLASDRQQLRDMALGTEPIVNLLPSLDPYIMGYRDRRRFLLAEHYDQVFDRAGNAFNTVWVNGTVVGIWREQDATIELLLWDEVECEALQAEAQRMGRFLLGQEVQAVVKAYPPDLYVRNPFTLARRR